MLIDRYGERLLDLRNTQCHRRRQVRRGRLCPRDLSRQSPFDR